MMPNQKRLPPLAQEALFPVVRKYAVGDLEDWHLRQHLDERIRWYPQSRLLNLQYFPVASSDLASSFVEEANSCFMSSMGFEGPGLKDVAASACRELEMVGSTAYMWLFPFHLGLRDLLGAPISFQLHLETPILLGDPSLGKMVVVRAWAPS